MSFLNLTILFYLFFSIPSHAITSDKSKLSNTATLKDFSIEKLRATTATNAKRLQLEETARLEKEEIASKQRKQLEASLEIQRNKTAQKALVKFLKEQITESAKNGKSDAAIPLYNPDRASAVEFRGVDAYHYEPGSNLVVDALVNFCKKNQLKYDFFIGNVIDQVECGYYFDSGLQKYEDTNINTVFIKVSW